MNNSNFYKEYSIRLKTGKDEHAYYFIISMRIIPPWMLFNSLILRDFFTFCQYKTRHFNSLSPYFKVDLQNEKLRFHCRITGFASSSYVFVFARVENFKEVSSHSIPMPTFGVSGQLKNNLS